MARRRLKMTKTAIAARRRYRGTRTRTRRPTRVRHSKLGTKRRGRARGGLFPQIFSAIGSAYKYVNKTVFN